MSHLRTVFNENVTKLYVNVIHSTTDYTYRVMLYDIQADS